MYQLEYLNIEENKNYEEIIEKVIEKCFKQEDLLESKLYVSITLTDPINIRRLNNEFRNVDKETDVLSFPMFEKKDLDNMIKNNGFKFEDVLGDIVISIERVEQQAKEYLTT